MSQSLGIGIFALPRELITIVSARAAGMIGMWGELRSELVAEVVCSLALGSQTRCHEQSRQIAAWSA